LIYAPCRFPSSPPAGILKKSDEGKSLKIEKNEWKMIKVSFCVRSSFIQIIVRDMHTYHWVIPFAAIF